MTPRCEQRCWPRCRPSMRLAWRFVRPAPGTPHRGIRISGAPIEGPQSAGVVPSAFTAAPRPLDKGKGFASSSSARGGAGASEEERRHRLRCADGSFVSDPLVGPRRPAPRSTRGPLVGPRRPAPRPRARRGASVLCHHNLQVRRHHNHHHRWVRRRHHHLGTISPRGTSSSNNNSSSSGRPASRVAERSRAPSECSPLLFPLVCLSCRRVLTRPLLVRATSPSAPKVVPHPPPPAAIEAAPPSPQAPVGGPAAAAPTPSGAAAAEGVPTAPTAATASTMAMSSSTPLAAAEEAPIAPAPAIKVDAGGASSSIPPPTPEETEVVFGRRLRSGAEPEAAPVPLPRVLSRAHQALQETEAAIQREWEALEAEHHRLDDWRT
jgi:hypothetical protein